MEVTTYAPPFRPPYFRSLENLYSFDPGGGGGGGTPYVMGDTYVPRFWPPFFTLAGSSTIFLGYFFSSTNTKTIFWGIKTTNSYRIRSFRPQISFFPRSFWVQFSAASGTPPSFFGPSTRGFDPLFSLWQDRVRSFWGIFSHPPTPKRSFGVLKLPILTEFDLLGPKFHFSLDLFGSNFQRPAAHPHHFSDRVPPRSFDPYFWAKMRKMSYFDPYFLSKFGKMYSFDPPFSPFVAFRVNRRCWASLSKTQPRTPPPPPPPPPRLRSSQLCRRC